MIVYRSKLCAVRRDAGLEVKADLYFHANTRMVDVVFIALVTLDISFKLYPYYSEYDTNIMPLVKAVTVYYHPDVNIYICRVNKALVMID